ncbi:MAG: zinc finger domain-containing protein, partial [Pseudomonadota bacterium]
LTVVEREPQDDAFRLEDPSIGVVFQRPDGEKCQRCWKILPDVGFHANPGVCARCNEALITWR